MLFAKIIKTYLQTHNIEFGGMQTQINLNLLSPLRIKSKHISLKPSEKTKLAIT